MPAPTVSLLQRAVRYANGMTRYEVTASVTNRGSLPHTELFVMTISDPLNPKSDTLGRVAVPHDLRTEGDAVYVRIDTSTLVVVNSDIFARIAGVDELTTIPRDRVRAVRSGSTEYLASTISVQYDKLTTANAAYRQIISRLSTLTRDYATYLATFVTSPVTVYSLPVADQSVEAELTAAYSSARTARVAAETERDAAQAAVTACITSGNTLNSALDSLVSDVSFLEAARAVVNATTETGSTSGGSCSVAPTVIVSQNVKDFVLNAGDARSYESLLNSKRAALQAAREEQATRATQRHTLSQRLAETEAAVMTARASEALALRSVYAVCPTFNPGVL